MAEILKELPSTIIAVAVGCSKGNMYPLKWALDNLVSQGSSLLLIHVYTPLRYIPAKVRNEDLAKLKQKQRNDLAPNIKKYERLCRQKQVKPIVSLVENDSTSKGLVDHINQLAISKLVIGHTPRNKLASAFFAPTKSDYVTKKAPHFCTVLTIHKDKLISQHANETISRIPSSFISHHKIGSDTLGCIDEKKRVVARKGTTGHFLTPIQEESWMMDELN